MKPQLELWKKILSILGYVLVIPYGIFEPVLKIPSLMVTSDDPSYNVHVGAALGAVIVHAVIIFFVFRAMRHRVAFGTSLLVAIVANLFLRAAAFFYAALSL